MKTYSIGIISFLLVIIFHVSQEPALAAPEGLTISGTVYNNVTRKPVEFGVVAVPKIKQKVRTDARGRYRITVPEAGTYTIFVQSSGLRFSRTTITLQANTVRDFYLRPLRVRGRELTIRGERDIQKISRKTMTRDQLKKVPGSFGDSLTALTALPGVTKSGDFFGPLVIRGADVISNNYYIDNIPIYNPYHYGGLHSIINNNLMNEIDLYSSSFPAQFGSATGAIININTVDSVKTFSGFADISILSTNVLVQAPIGEAALVPAGTGNGKAKEKNGYWIVSGRYGYLSLIVPRITPEEIEVSPEYWDYQVKLKYYLNSNNSLSLLIFGSSDIIKILKKDSLEEGEDPYLESVEFSIDQMSHSQGFYYTYEPSKKLKNQLIAFSSLRKSYFYLNSLEQTTADWARDFTVTSRPSIFGIKDRYQHEWWEDRSVLRAGIDYQIFYFTASGNALVLRSAQPVDGGPPGNLGDPDAAVKYRLDEKIINHTVGGFLEDKFTFGGLTIVPGIRSDYLKRSEETTVDPRGMISYDFSTGTTISAAGGKYSYFYQTNPFIFDTSPDVAKLGKELKPEQAFHRSVAVEQKIDLWIFKVEGFYNTFKDKPVDYAHYNEEGMFMPVMSSGKLNAYGSEIMVRKDLEGDRGLFGWFNYTYTRSRFKSGLPTEAGLYGNSENLLGDPLGDTWINWKEEQKHALKMTAGYQLAVHTFTMKFQLYSGSPYTPIIGGDQTDPYYTEGDRYIPEYGEKNSKYFPLQHRLDVRYSYRANYTWGYISWYFEILNIYNNKPVNNLKWDYRYPYGPDNPELEKDEGPFSSITPNFGVEIKF